MVSHYIEKKKKKVNQITRKKVQACSTRKWAKFEHKILFDNKIKFGLCLKKNLNKQAWPFNIWLVYNPTMQLENIHKFS